MPNSASLRGELRHRELAQKPKHLTESLSMGSLKDFMDLRTMGFDLLIGQPL